MPLPKKSIVKKTPAKKVPAKKTTKKPMGSGGGGHIVGKVPKQEKETEMNLFACKSCNKKFPDTGSYFYGKKSEKCLWCTKFPKSKK